MGLSDQRSWELTPRELRALQEVYEADLQRWGLTQAMFANVNFRDRDSSGRAIDEPYTADDFLGRGNRQQRALQSQKSKVDAAMVNARLLQMKPGEISDDIPDWAKGAYHG